MLLAGVHALRPADIRALTLDDADPAAGTLLAGGRARRLDQLTAGVGTGRCEGIPVACSPLGALAVGVLLLLTERECGNAQVDEGKGRF